MNEHTDSDLQAELAALRQRLSNLEAEHRELQRRGSRSHRPVVSRKLLLSVLPVALLLAAGGVLYAVDALFVDKDGNVRIGGAVGINRDAISNQHLVIQPKQGNVPFNVTDPTSNVNWLSVFSDGKVIMNGGNVGIGTRTPGTKLDVNGTLNVTDNSTLNKDTTINGGLTVTGNGNSSFTGNVGIGTTSPGTKLDVNGTLNVTANSTLSGLTVTGKGNSSFTGKVGIGTTSPGATLDVVGPVMDKFDVIQHPDNTNDWADRGSPVMNYFKEKLNGKPVGTHIRAIVNNLGNPRQADYVWDAWVATDGKIKVLVVGKETRVANLPQ